MKPTAQEMLLGIRHILRDRYDFSQDDVNQLHLDIKHNGVEERYHLRIDEMDVDEGLRMALILKPFGLMAQPTAVIRRYDNA